MKMKRHYRSVQSSLLLFLIVVATISVIVVKVFLCNAIYNVINKIRFSMRYDTKRVPLQSARASDTRVSDRNVSKSMRN